MKSKELLPIAAAISFFALNAHAQTPAQLQGVDHGSQSPSHRIADGHPESDKSGGGSNCWDVVLNSVIQNQISEFTKGSRELHP